MKKISIITTALFMAVFVASTAFAFGPGGGHGDRPDREERQQKFVEHLDLTEEQQEQMKGMREKNRAEMKEIREEVRSSRRALQDELKKTDVDKDAVYSAADKVKSAQNKMVDQKVEGFLEMKEILTPEQFSRLGEMRQNARGKRRERWMEKRKERRR